jgi:hypothetical protein
MQNHDFDFSVKSHTHNCTAQLTSDVIQRMSAVDAGYPSSPSSPVRRNTQTLRSTAARSPLCSSARTSAAVAAPPPAASFSSLNADAPSPLKAQPSQLSPPPSRHGKAAARSPSPSGRVSFVSPTPARTRRGSTLADATRISSGAVHRPAGERCTVHAICLATLLPVPCHARLHLPTLPLQYRGEVAINQLELIVSRIMMMVMKQW